MNEANKPTMNVAQVVTDFASTARGRRSSNIKSGPRGPVADLIQLAVLATQAVEEMWLDPKFRPRIESAKRGFGLMPTTFVHRRSVAPRPEEHKHIGDRVRSEMNSTVVIFGAHTTDARKRGRPFANDSLSVALRRFERWVSFGDGFEATEIFRPPVIDERERGEVLIEMSQCVRSGKVVERLMRTVKVERLKLRASLRAEHRRVRKRLIGCPHSDYKSWAKEFERFVNAHASYEVNLMLGLFHRIAKSKLTARQRSQLKRGDGRYDKDTKKALWTAFRQVVEARFRRLMGRPRRTQLAN